jgi:hypothetical protein
VVLKKPRLIAVRVQVPSLVILSINKRLPNYFTLRFITAVSYGKTQLYFPSFQILAIYWVYFGDFFISQVSGFLSGFILSGFSYFSDFFLSGPFILSGFILFHQVFILFK